MEVRMETLGENADSKNQEVCENYYREIVGIKKKLRGITSCKIEERSEEIDRLKFRLDDIEKRLIPRLLRTISAG